MQNTLKLTKKTKNTARYDAEDPKNEAGTNVCNSLYVNLSAFEGEPPAEITVALEGATITVK